MVVVVVVVVVVVPEPEKLASVLGSNILRQLDMCTYTHM